MLTTIYARVWVHEWVSVGGWFYIGVSLVSCVHSLILLNNSVQVYVISALELKFGHRNGVSQWVYELTNNIECEVGGKGVGSSSEKFHVHTESPGGSKRCKMFPYRGR